jgi:lysine-specific demethylase 8
MNESPIEIASSMTADEFAAFVDAGRPVLIKRFVSDTVACRSWSIDAFREQLRETIVPVEVSLSGDFSGGMQTGEESKRTVEMSASEFLDRLLGEHAHGFILGTGEKYYARQTPLGMYPPVAGDLPVPAVIDGGRYGGVLQQIWISGAGHVTPAHTDCWVDNLFTQIVGRKSVRLWNPGEADRLYLRPFGEPHSRVVAVDPDAPDLDRYPRFAEAQALTGTLEPGDVLYIPQGWIHYVRTDALSVSVSHWFNHQAQFEGLVLAVAHYLITVRPELRALYLHLFHWPPSILTERIV